MTYETVQVINALGASAYMAVDTVGGAEIQIVKLDLGGDGASTPVSSSVPVSLSAAIPAGTNNIGDVDVLTLPALPAGTNNIGDVDVVSLPSLPAGTNAIGKLSANSGVDIGDVDDVVAQGKLEDIKTLLGGTVATQVWKSVNYTTTQTGAAIWTPTSTKKIGITHLVIGTYGTTSARVILWFGASGDTTYNEGTDQAVFKGSFAPSASALPGAILQPATPILASTADHVLRITTDAAISIDITVYGYEF